MAIFVFTTKLVVFPTAKTLPCEWLLWDRYNQQVGFTSKWDHIHDKSSSKEVSNFYWLSCGKDFEFEFKNTQWEGLTLR